MRASSIVLTPPITATLSYQQSEGRVRVCADHQDVMILSVKEAIQACRAFEQQIAFKDQFDRLLVHLAQWVQSHSHMISDAFLTLRDSGLLFLVVQREPAFNGELERELTNLELDIANEIDYNLIRLSVHSLPKCDDGIIRSFASKKMALRYQVDGE